MYNYTKKLGILHHFEFEHFYLFLLLLLIICIYKCPHVIRTLFFPHLQLFTKFTNYINKEKLLYSFIFALLVTALTSPISYDSKISNHRKGRDLIFTLDTSGSMGESGYSAEQKTQGKFELLKDLIEEFITHRFDDNVGVSVFGSFAFSSVPLTYDMQAVSFLLNFVEVGIAGENTAIGDGLTEAIALLDKGTAKSKVIILVTDGYQNSGEISIGDAVKSAKKRNIKIYTIGIGKKSQYDSKLLEKIAKDTQAKMFEAKDAEALKIVYKTLNTLEKSPIHSQNYLNKQMLFFYPLGIAVLLLIYLLMKKREL